MTEDTDRTDIVSAVRAVLPDVSIIEWSTLAGGMSARMNSVVVESRDGRRRRLVVRQPPGSDRAHRARAVLYETRVLRLAHAAGLKSPRVLEPHSADLPSKRSCVVMEWFDGKPDYAPADRVRYAEMAAEQLAAIHSAQINSNQVMLLRRRDISTTEVRQSPAEGVDLSLQAQAIRSVLQTVRSFPQHNQSVLLHGDFWPGNILCNNTRFVGVVDWEDACYGDPLADFGSARLELSWILGLPAMNAFTKRYRSLMRIDYRQLPVWDLIAALRLIRAAEGDFTDWAAAWRVPPFNRADITERCLRANYQAFLTQAFKQLSL